MAEIAVAAREEVRREAFTTGFVAGIQHALDLVRGTYETAERRREWAESTFQEWQAYLAAGGVNPQAWADSRNSPEPFQDPGPKPSVAQSVATVPPKQSTLFSTEAVTTGPCRIDIVEYKRRREGGYHVLFNGEGVGYATKGRWLAVLLDGELFREATFRTRGEAAARLIRRLHPEWKGTAP